MKVENRRSKAGRETFRPIFAFAAVLLSAALARADGTASAFAKIPEAPIRRVTDVAGFLSSGAAAELDAELLSFEQRTGHQFLVYIGRSTEPTTLEEWAVRAFEQWGVGKKGKDDGVALFLMAEDKKVRVEVGYGLEGTLPDALAGKIVTEVIVAKLKAGQRDEAIRAGVTALESAIEGKGANPPPGSAPGRPKSEGPGCLGWIVIAIVAAIFLYILITNPSLALWLLVNALTSGRGGGGGGGGGWSGGGGRSGGGGASGSW